jgi:hypothetical protein
MSIHNKNKTPCSMTTLSKVIIVRKKIWSMQKEIKDVYPKKVCHMLTRHVYKKEKRCIPKEDMPHAHKACQKK